MRTAPPIRPPEPGAPERVPHRPEPEPAADAPTVLAIDASSGWCSAALLRRGAIMALDERIGQGHTRRLLPMVDALLARHGLRPADCDAIGFGAGPGAFTGLRIACGIAQGLGWAAGRPVVPIDCISAAALHARRLLAAGAGAASPATGVAAAPVAVALDARMGEVYFGLDAPGRSRPAPHDGPMHDAIGLARPEAAAARLQALLDAAGVSARAAICAGDGFERDAPAFSALTAAARAVLPQAHAHAEAIALLAAARLRREGAGAFDASRAAPRYVRDKVALDVDEQQALRQARAGRP